MIWAKLAATGNFLLAGIAAFLAYGLFLGEARALLPALTDGQHDFMMIALTVYALAMAFLGGLLLRGYPIAGFVSVLLHLATVGGTFAVVDMSQGNELVRQVPRWAFQAIVVALDLKAALALAGLRRESRVGAAAR